MCDEDDGDYDDDDGDDDDDSDDCHDLQCSSLMKQFFRLRR